MIEKAINDFRRMGGTEKELNDFIKKVYHGASIPYKCEHCGERNLEIKFYKERKTEALRTTKVFVLKCLERECRRKNYRKEIKVPCWHDYDEDEYNDVLHSTFNFLGENLGRSVVNNILWDVAQEEHPVNWVNFK